MRNAADLSVMSVPAKYRELGDFPAYYSGAKKAPYLTIFIAGNHEASSYLWELYYGGWVAPNIYYLGAANVLRFGPLRIAAMSGIWKGFDYRKSHHERLPFSQDDIKSFYHVREIDIRKLLLLREQVDVGLSHDWPRGIENHGNAAALWRMKPDFRQESIDGTLGNPAAEYVMDRLRPAYWFSAHMHCKFAAIRKYPAPTTRTTTTEPSASDATLSLAPGSEQLAGNPDEIDLDNEEAEQPAGNPDEIDLDDEEDVPTTDVNKANISTQTETQPGHQPSSGVADELRAQLPASFAIPAAQRGPKLNPGQPVPPSITNTTTRFLALDKCLPGRKYIQLSTLQPVDPSHLTQYPPSDPTTTGKKKRYALQYDPEWLAITRVFSRYLTVGEPSVVVPPDLGEETYMPLIDAERAWVDEHIVRAGKLAVPDHEDGFQITAPPHQEGDPETVPYQPDEYTNPQTVAFCELVGVKNLWDASPEERAERKARGPPPASSMSERRGGGFRGRGGGRGGGGRGRGRGGFMGLRGRGRGRGGSRGGEWH